MGMVPDKNLRPAIGVSAIGVRAIGASGIGVFSPTRIPPRQLGTVPGKNLRPAIEGMRDGRDEVLQDAVMLTAVQMIDRRLFAIFPLKANVPFRLWEIAVHLAEPVR